VLDHIVFATNDLDATTAWLAQATGVTASAGGAHVNMGTRNALCALGDGAYLEIIGVDPDQPEPAQPRVYGIDTLTSPGVVGWCARRGDIPGLMMSAAGLGLSFTGPTSMQREAPSGLLSWELTMPDFDNAGGLVPSFIKWSTATHPSQDAAPGLELVTFRADHPEPGDAVYQLQRLGEPIEVRRGSTPALKVRVSGPGGAVTLPTAEIG
jgi:hypothetical protein